MTTPEVVAVGSALVDRLYRVSNLPEPDGGAFAHEETRAAGGVAANVATGVSRLGRGAGVVSRVGDDERGAFVRDDLAERDIDARLQVGESEATSHAIVLRDAEGERMIVAGGESVRNLELRAEDLDYCRGADVVFTSAYAPDRVVARLADAAREGSLPPLAFDLAGPMEELEDRGVTPETLDALLPHLDLFVANAVAARSYFGGGPRDAVEALRDRGVRRAAVTRGTDGAILLDGDETVEIPAFRVETVDTTGAGDAFVAGLIHAWLLDDADVREAGRFAAAAAAINCRGEGARGGLPTRADVAAFLEG